MRGEVEMKTEKRRRNFNFGLQIEIRESMFLFQQSQLKRENFFAIL